MKKLIAAILVLIASNSQAVSIGNFKQIEAGSLAGTLEITDTHNQGVLVIASLNNGKKPSYTTAVADNKLVLTLKPQPIVHGDQLAIKVIKKGVATERVYNLNSQAPAEAFNQTHEIKNYTTSPIVAVPTEEAEPRTTFILNDSTESAAVDRVNCDLNLDLAKGRLLSHILEEYIEGCGLVASWEVKSVNDVIDYRIDETTVIDIPNGIEGLAEVLNHWHGIKTERYEQKVVFSNKR